MKRKTKAPETSYFQSVIKRKNPVKDAILNLAFSLCSYPRMIIEVFIRKGFGKRYFSLGTAVFIFLLLLVGPSVWDRVGNFGSYPYQRYAPEKDTAAHLATWYMFAVAFLIFSIRQHREIKRNGSVFNFDRFSLSSGNVNRRFYDLKIPFLKVDVRMIEIYLEPLFVLIIGFVLVLAGQTVGTLLMVSATLYGLSYAGAYRKGDDHVMDKIDEMIMNEEIGNALVKGLRREFTRGVPFYNDVPESQDMREKLAASLNSSDDDDLLFAA